MQITSSMAQSMGIHQAGGPHLPPHQSMVHHHHHHHQSTTANLAAVSASATFNSGTGGGGLVAATAGSNGVNSGPLLTGFQGTATLLDSSSSSPLSDPALQSLNSDFTDFLVQLEGGGSSTATIMDTSNSDVLGLSTYLGDGTSVSESSSVVKNNNPRYTTSYEGRVTTYTGLAGDGLNAGGQEPVVMLSGGQQMHGGYSGPQTIQNIIATNGGNIANNGNANFGENVGGLPNYGAAGQDSAADFLPSFGISPTGEIVHSGPDNNGEEIWDLDSNTVRRYNNQLGPDPSSPGPIPTTPTMYGGGAAQQLQQQHPHLVQNPNVKKTTTGVSNDWDMNNAGGASGVAAAGVYANGSHQFAGSGLKRGPTPHNAPPPQAISPGIGGPWIGGSVNVKTVALTSGGTTSEAKRPKSYQCEACDKWFTSSGHLKRHFNTTLHKNAIKQKTGGNDGYVLEMLGGSAGGSGSFSIPSVESRGAPSPCVSLGEESSQSSVCDGELPSSSQSTSVQSAGHLNSSSSAVGGAPLPTSLQQLPPHSVITTNPSLPVSTSYLPARSPHFPASSNNCSPSNASPSQILLSPPISSTSSNGLDSTSSPQGSGGPLIGQHQVSAHSLNLPSTTPQPSVISPMTPSSGVSISPNAMAGSPAAANQQQKSRYSPFRSCPSAGAPPSSTVTSSVINNLSYKVQTVDPRNNCYIETVYSTPVSSFQPHAMTTSAMPMQVQQQQQMSANNGFGGVGDVYMPAQNSYRNVSGGVSGATADMYGGSGPSGGANNMYNGQYHAAYQPIQYSGGVSTYEMGPTVNNGGGYAISSGPHYTDLSGAAYLGGNGPPPGADNIHVAFADPLRGAMNEERGSPEGSEESDLSLKNENGEFRCNECNKAFNRMCYLKQHNKSFHNGEKPYKCNQCGKRFPVEVLYQEHLAKHAGDKPYKCDVCPKQFNHKTDLRRHMCLHTGEKPFACETCGKGFIREDRMVKHADTHKKKNAHVAATAAAAGHVM